MSLLPADANYLEHVQAFFLAFRGDGLALSPLDAQLLMEWYQRGIPYLVLCQAIRKSAETVMYHQKAGARLRTLRSCRSAVEREYRRWQGISAAPSSAVNADLPSQQTAGESFALKRLKKAKAALSKALANSTLAPYRQALECAQQVLKNESRLPSEVFQMIVRAENTLAIMYVRSLPYGQRCALLREARQQAGPCPEWASPKARKDALRAHLLALARSVGQLVVLT